MPGFHTKKQKRQAKHIISSCKKRGKGLKACQRMAWATVNKNKNKRRK